MSDALGWVWTRVASVVGAVRPVVGVVSVSWLGRRG